MTIRLEKLERQARMVGGDGGKTHGWLQSWLVKDARAREGGEDTAGEAVDSSIQEEARR